MAIRVLAALCSRSAGWLRIAPGGERRPDFERLAAIRPLGIGVLMDDGNLTSAAMRMRLPPGAKILSPRIVAAERSIVLSGGTARRSPVVQFSRETDFLIHEAMTVDAIDRLAGLIGCRGESPRKRPLRDHTRPGDCDSDRPSRRLGHRRSITWFGLMILNALAGAGAGLFALTARNRCMRTEWTD